MYKARPVGTCKEFSQVLNSDPDGSGILRPARLAAGFLNASYDFYTRSESNGSNSCINYKQTSVWLHGFACIPRSRRGKKNNRFSVRASPGTVGRLELESEMI